MKNLLLVSVLFISMVSNAQKKAEKSVNEYVDFATAFGSSENTIATSYVHNWKLGKKKKFEIGWGVRFTNYFGTNKEFITAPAKLTKTSTAPFAILFADQIPTNIDTLTVQKAQTNSLNLSINLAYNLSSKFSIGFNIDAIGVTFGRNSSSILQTNGVLKKESSTKPYAFNLLLTGENDLGTLNSEFFIKYQLNNKWALRGVLQHFFVEYQTKTQKQIVPNGTMNDRFRNISDMVGLGVSYTF